MESFKLYRRRLIPEECILLKDDLVIKHTDDILITKWNTLNTKTAFTHGSSCYFLKYGYKISKFYHADHTLHYWYCDIIEHHYNQSDNTLIVTDLLADVIIYPDGKVEVIDLEELADALDNNYLTQEQLKKCLRQLSELLNYIYTDSFYQLTKELENLGL